MRSGVPAATLSGSPHAEVGPRACSLSNLDDAVFDLGMFWLLEKAESTPLPWHGEGGRLRCSGYAGGQGVRAQRAPKLL